MIPDILVLTPAGWTDQVPPGWQATEASCKFQLWNRPAGLLLVLFPYMEEQHQTLKSLLADPAHGLQPDQFLGAGMAVRGLPADRGTNWGATSLLGSGNPVGRDRPADAQADEDMIKEVRDKLADLKLI